MSEKEGFVYKGSWSAARSRKNEESSDLANKTKSNHRYLHSFRLIDDLDEYLESANKD
ncbi:MAG TPA: hypothetical protein VFE91_06035 [Nitrososphaerales archaeon]|nr:hypothetical protein [Nitrososphaerales archaeon]